MNFDYLIRWLGHSLKASSLKISDLSTVQAEWSYMLQHNTIWNVMTWQLKYRLQMKYFENNDINIDCQSFIQSLKITLVSSFSTQSKEFQLLYFNLYRINNIQSPLRFFLHSYFFPSLFPTNHPSFLSSPLLSIEHLILSVFCWCRLCAVGSIDRSWGDRISSSCYSSSSSSSRCRSGFIGVLTNKINKM